jgi:hypothetical protein
MSKTFSILGRLEFYEHETMPNHLDKIPGTEALTHKVLNSKYKLVKNFYKAITRNYLDEIL